VAIPLSLIVLLPMFCCYDFLWIVIIVENVIPLVDPGRLVDLGLIWIETMDLRQFLPVEFSGCIIFDHSISFSNKFYI